MTIINKPTGSLTISTITEVCFDCQLHCKQRIIYNLQVQSCVHMYIKLMKIELSFNSKQNIINLIK
jgi:hypothetical protein